MQLFPVVRLLQAVNQRPALNRHFTRHMTQQRIAINPAYRHWQGERQGIALLPAALNMQIAFTDIAGHLRAVQRDVRIGAPVRQTQRQRVVNRLR